MFRSLALGGGGVRGGFHVGALYALEKSRGDLQFPDGIYGCSIGSILATAVAFNMNASQIRSMFDSHFNLSKVMPTIRLSSVYDLILKKGLFSMDSLESTIIDAFASQQVDLKGKLIEDAPQKLYIVASNMTTKIPVILQGKVPILDAIKCSSCIPLVFSPQVLYNHVYLDGGVLMDSISDIVPEDTLVLHISEPNIPIYTSDLSSISITTFMHRIYRSIRGSPSRKNMIWFSNDTIAILQELSDEDKKVLFDSGYLQTVAFLTKFSTKELH